MKKIMTPFAWLPVALMLTLLSNTLSSQAFIKGQVLDKSNGDTLPFASITIHQGGAPVKQTISDINGCFHTEVAPGTYSVVTRYVGYNVDSVVKVVVGKDKNAAIKIRLKQSICILTECIIIARGCREPLIWGCPGMSCGIELLPPDTSRMEADTISVAVKENPEELKYYPNPCQGDLTIETDHLKGELFLTDLNGKILLKIEPSGEKITLVNMKAYSTGIYYLRYRVKDTWKNGKVVLVR